MLLGGMSLRLWKRASEYVIEVECHGVRVPNEYCSSTFRYYDASRVFQDVFLKTDTQKNKGG